MLACFSHWYTSLLYVAPVPFVGAFVWVQSLRDRRKDDDDHEGGAGRHARVDVGIE